MLSILEQTLGQSKIDSLVQVLKICEDDTSKVNTLNALCVQFYQTGDFKQSRKYATEALILSNSLQMGSEKGWTKGKANSYSYLGVTYFLQGNYPVALKINSAALSIRKVIDDKKGIADSYNNIGLIYSNLGNYQEALKNHLAALKIRQENGDKKGIAASQSNIGTIYNLQGKYENALKNYFSSLKTSEELGDKRGIASASLNIGGINYNQGNYSEALKNYFTSLKISEELGDKLNISNCYTNIGVIYAKQGNYTEAQKSHLTALSNFEEIGHKKGAATSYNNIGGNYKEQGNFAEAGKNYLSALKIFEETHDIQGVAYCYNNIAAVFEEQGNYDEALKNYINSLQMKEQIGDKKGMTGTKIKLGGFFFHRKNYTQAIAYLNNGLSLAKETGSKEDIKDAYSKLAETYSKIKDYKKALEYHQLYSEIKDTILNEESSRQTNEMKTIYETEKKDQEIELLNKDKQVKQVQIEKQRASQRTLIIIGVGIFILIVLGFFLYRSNSLLEKLKLQQEIKQQEINLRSEFKDNLHDDLNSDINAIKGNSLFISGLKDHQLKKELIMDRMKWISVSCEKILLNTEILIRENSSNADSADELFADMLNHLEFSLPGIEIERRNLPTHKTNRSIPIIIRKNYFLIFKESINNIEKHAECTQVIVSWGLDKNKLFLEIEDNGKGFDFTNTFDGNGLESFKRRAEKINGTFHIESTPGKGTKIILEAHLT